MSNTTKLRITVTKEILEKTKMCGIGVNSYPPSNCAVSVAIKDFFPDAMVYGGGQLAFFGEHFEQESKLLFLPDEAADWILNFDLASPQDRPNLPEISFEINVPDWVIERINIDEIRPLLQNHPNLSLIEQ